MQKPKFYILSFILKILQCVLGGLLFHIVIQFKWNFGGSQHLRGALMTYQVGLKCWKEVFKKKLLCSHPFIGIQMNQKKSYETRCILYFITWCSPALAIVYGESYTFSVISECYILTSKDAKLCMIAQDILVLWEAYHLYTCSMF